MRNKTRVSTLLLFVLTIFCGAVATVSGQEVRIRGSLDRQAPLQKSPDPSDALRKGDIHLKVTTRLPDQLRGYHVWGDRRLFFKAVSLSEDQAVARFWTKDGKVNITSHIFARTAGEVDIDDVSFSGHGAIGTSEMALLRLLSQSALADQLALIPLELGCSVRDEAGVPMLAALIQPWHILFKYTGAPVAERRLLDEVACVGRQYPGGRAVSLQEGAPIATVYGFFTLDDEGAAIETITKSAPCGATCRGACGSNCAGYHCYSLGSCRYQCGTHNFCRYHDACYDNCHATHGCSSITGWSCERGCDEDCLAVYGITTCLAWADGNGPFDGPELSPYGEPGYWTFFDGCPTSGGGGNPGDPPCSCDCDGDGWVTPEECVFDCNGVINGEYCDV